MLTHPFSSDASAKPLRLRATSRAFTLVELLVVIGIIALLISLLLPVLSRVQGHARDLKCQSNLRAIGQALMAYTVDNKGSLPYGLVFEHNDPNNWGDTDRTYNSFYCWASQVGKYMGRRKVGDNEESNFPPALQCPEALQTLPHVLGYVANAVAMPAPVYEFEVPGVTARTAAIKPATVSRLRPQTILVHDTAIDRGWDQNLGYIVNLDVDNQHFWRGAATPQWRYFRTNDPYPALGQALQHGQNSPVLYDEENWKNADIISDGDIPNIGYQGNLRYRHARNTTCNTLFADGHVEAFHEGQVLRHYFMTKWPQGVPKDDTYP